jgi:hypothetical protein
MSNKITVYRTAQGYDWQITAAKQTGCIIVNAQAGGKTSGGGWASTIFVDPNVLLYREACHRVTEDKLRAAFQSGLAKFDAMLAAGEIPHRKEAQPGEEWTRNGQVVIIAGPRKDYGEFPTIDPTTGRFGYNINLKGWTKTGHLFADNFDTMLAIAQQHEDEENRKFMEARAKEDAEIEAREAAIDQFIPSIPTWAAAGIIAQYRQNRSDIMTDYFSASVEREILLSWSSTTRNNMDELIAAVQNCPEVAEAMQNQRSEKHNGGHDYYYGIGGYSTGWRIIKSDNLRYCAGAALQGNHAPQERPASNADPRSTGEAMVTINRAKNGIEIRFPYKPSDEILAEIRRAGFRWGRFAKCWYAQDNSRNRDFAQRFGLQPAEARDQGGDMLDAQSEQAADRWAAHNL